MLNQMAGHKQFVVEEESIYGQQYGRRRQANGFTGFGHLPEPQAAPAQHGGFSFAPESDYGGIFLYLTFFLYICYISIKL